MPLSLQTGIARSPLTSDSGAKPHKRPAKPIQAVPPPSPYNQGLEAAHGLLMSMMDPRRREVPARLRRIVSGVRVLIVAWRR
jgi:hypothetical protein